MIKSTKILMGILSGILALCFAMGIFVRNSYTGYSTFLQMEKEENLEEYYVQVSDVEEYDVFETSVENYEDLEKVSDLIVKVSATDERKLFPHTTTKTKVMIEEVWKGNVKAGQSIFIYEPAVFSYSVNKCYKSIGGYQLMEKGEEYYLCLRKLNASEGYKMSKKEKNTYLPSTASYSKFPVQEGNAETVDRHRLDSDGYTYGETKNMEIITSKEKMLSEYKNIKEELLKNIS